VDQSTLLRPFLPSLLEGQRHNMEGLGEGVAHVILLKLDSPSVARCACVSRTWRAHACSEDVWEHFARQDCDLDSKTGACAGPQCLVVAHTLDAPLSRGLCSSRTLC
jgi:hypothetical protein